LLAPAAGHGCLGRRRRSSVQGIPFVWRLRQRLQSVPKGDLGKGPVNALHGEMRGLR